MSNINAACIRGQSSLASTNNNRIKSGGLEAERAQPHTKPTLVLGRE
jgi:hypothetical protein